MDGRAMADAAPPYWSVLPRGTPSKEQFWKARSAMLEALGTLAAEGVSLEDLEEEIDGMVNAMRLSAGLLDPARG
jgi:hypothetical protein